MSFVATQYLRYPDNEDEILFLGKVLDLLETRRITEAKRLLVARQDVLQNQEPTLSYFPSECHI